MELWGVTIISLAIAFVIALAASRGERKIDFFVKWFLAALMISLIFLIFWGVIEVMNQRGMIIIPPFLGHLEYITFWGSTISLFISMILFTTALLIQAITSKPEQQQVLPQPVAKYIVVYKTPVKSAVMYITRPEGYKYGSSYPVYKKETQPQVVIQKRRVLE